MRNAAAPAIRKLRARTAALSLASVAFAIIGCTSDRASGEQGASELRSGTESPAFALERDVEAIAASHSGERSLWPGYDPLAIPLAVYDGERTYLFRHPKPPDGFGAVAGTEPAVYSMPGRNDAITANSSATIGGVETATVLLDKAGSQAGNRAALAVHEAFHVFQRQRHPAWIGNEVDLFVYPDDNAELVALRRLETRALRNALSSDSNGQAACWSRLALALRRQRFDGLDSASAQYERGTELNEGIATYVEGRGAGRASVNIPEGGFAPADVRLRAYATGPALALLLDQFAPGWPASFEADDRQTLDGALSRALSSSAESVNSANPGCAFSAAESADEGRKATADVAALGASRRERLSLFERRAGSRLLVDASANPIWPQGFDPINVERVGPASVLHSRFLKVGNDAGQLEFLDSDSVDVEGLTVGVGPHPLFNGISRVEISGLSMPQVSEDKGVVTVRAPGLTATFSGATATRSGEVITVRLGR